MNKQIVEQKLKEITGKIVKEYQPKKVILFGSWAWGNPGPDSDLDLFIIKDTKQPSFKRIETLDRMFSRREVPMDFLIYTPEELEHRINEERNLFLEDILRNGRILYAKAGSETFIKHKESLTILQ